MNTRFKVEYYGKGRPMKLVFAFLVLGALLVVSSCKKDDTTVVDPPQEFQVKIDSVKLSKNAVWNDTLRARLWGKIGASTCYQFARYETTRDSFQATVKVFGALLSSGNCTPATVELRSAIYRIYPVYPGKFTMTIQQPNGTTLQDTTTVLP